MRKPSLLACCTLLSLAGQAWMPTASAEMNPFNMMNPSKWFNSRDNDDHHYRDRYYDRYDRYGYGGGGPWGYGGGPYGGGPWGYGGGPYGGGPWGYGPYGGGPWGNSPWGNNNPSNNTPPPPRLPE